MFEEGYLSEDLAALCDPADLKEMPDNDRLLSLIRQRLEVLLASDRSDAYRIVIPSTS